MPTRMHQKPFREDPSPCIVADTMLDFTTDRIVSAIPEPVLYELETRARAWCKAHGATLQSTGRSDTSPYQPSVFARVRFANERFFEAHALTVDGVVDDLSRLGLLVRSAGPE